jgi:tetratricopeptide (TPR) repeat protein
LGLASEAIKLRSLLARARLKNFSVQTWNPSVSFYVLILMSRAGTAVDQVEVRMETSGLFWIATVVMVVVAFGFVAMPLLKANRKATLLAVAIAVPLLAAGLYRQLGSPDTNGVSQRSNLPQGPASSVATGTASTNVGSVASMIEGLASRLRDNPDDGGSWLLLARSYRHLNRLDEAADAYEKAAALGQFDAELAELDGTSNAPAAGTRIYGNVRLSPDAAGIVQPTDTVFIFAKALYGPPAPIAVLQRAASELPIDFLLNDSQSMVAGVKLSDFDEVVVTARITRGGDATVSLQGLEAKSDTILVADNRHLNLTIE